jgi:hypothetical protein
MPGADGTLAVYACAYEHRLSAALLGPGCTQQKTPRCPRQRHRVGDRWSLMIYTRSPEDYVCERKRAATKPPLLIDALCRMYSWRGLPRDRRYCRSLFWEIANLVPSALANVGKGQPL